MAVAVTKKTDVEIVVTLTEDEIRAILEKEMRRQVKRKLPEDTRIELRCSAGEPPEAFDAPIFSAQATFSFTA